MEAPLAKKLLAKLVTSPTTFSDGLPFCPNAVGEVTSLVDNFLSSDASVDRFLADQLLIYMAISKTGSFTTNELSTHLTTNIETIKKFLPVDFIIEHQGKTHRISCKSM